MIAFKVADMSGPRCVGVITRAVHAVDRAAVVRVEMDTLTVEIEPVSANARQLSDALKRAGYAPEAA